MIGIKIQKRLLGYVRIMKNKGIETLNKENFRMFLYKNLRYKKNRVRTLFILILIMYILVLYNIIHLNTGFDISVSFSPDESSLLFTAKNIEKTGNIFWISDLNEIYETSFFHLRGMVEIKENVYITKYSVYLAILSSLSCIFSFNTLLIPLISLMGLLFFYMFLTDIFSSEKVGMVATLLLGVFPPYILYSQVHMDIVPSLAFLFASLFSFNRFLKNDELKYLILSLLFFVVSVMIRTPLIIAGISFIIPATAYYKKFLKTETILILFVTISFLLILYLGINKEIFGSFFETGRTTEFSSHQGKGLAKTFMIPSININSMKINFLNYFLKYNPFILLMGISGLSIVLISGNKILKTWMLGFVISSIYIFIIFGKTSGASGFGVSVIQSSYSRYFHPIYVMLMIGTSYSFCFLLKKRNIIKMFLVTALIVSLFLFSFGESSGNVMYIKNYRDRTQDVNLKIKNTPEKSVFFVIRNDKVIIDTRPVFLCGEFEKEKKDINELFRIINLLEKDNYEIYLSKEAKNIKKGIIERGGKIIEIENFPFYKLEMESCSYER